MKRALPLFFLSLFCFSTLQSVIPYFEYVFNYEYIAKVLCINKETVELNCNGKCHLKKQLSKTVSDSKTKNQKRVHDIKFDQRLLILVKLQHPFLQIERRGLKPKGLYFENLKQNRASKPPTPPPKFYLLSM